MYFYTKSSIHDNTLDLPQYKLPHTIIRSSSIHGIWSKTNKPNCFFNEKC